jgi:hypothetical protein
MEWISISATHTSMNRRTVSITNLWAGFLRDLTKSYAAVCHCLNYCVISRPLLSSDILRNFEQNVLLTAATLVETFETERSFKADRTFCEGGSCFRGLCLLTSFQWRRKDSEQFHEELQIICCGWYPVNLPRGFTGNSIKNFSCYLLSFNPILR